MAQDSDIDIINAKREWEERVNNDYCKTIDRFTGTFQGPSDINARHFEFLLIEDETAYYEWEDGDFSESEEETIFTDCLDNRRDYLESFGYIYPQHDD